eukprot:15343544-Alexandrium_andersonii.AAC.1
MSASLVGSEMCIRDSLSGGPPRPRSSAPSGGSRARRPYRAAAPALLPPVSYTHLTLPTICSV